MTKVLEEIFDFTKIGNDMVEPKIQTQTLRIAILRIEFYKYLVQFLTLFYSKFEISDLQKPSLLITV